MNEELKTQAWSQGIYQQSTTQKEALGALRILSDGRKFRYGRAGSGAALAIGQLCGTAPAIAHHIKQANTGYTMAVGATSVTVLLGATAATEDQYKDGYLQIYDGASTAVGQNLRISSNPAAALSTAMRINLADPVQYACIATDTYSLIPNPWSVCIVMAATATPPAGVPMTKIAASAYGWFQTGGVACVLNSGNTALGTEITNTNSGAFITATTFTSYAQGYTIAFAGVTAKYNPVFLTID